MIDVTEVVAERVRVILASLPPGETPTIPPLLIEAKRIHEVVEFAAGLAAACISAARDVER
jgi:hypothetical protein